jgi:RNA polymerase-binding protein DksA
MSKRTDIDFEEFRALLQEERARLLQQHHEQRAEMLEEAHDVSENELSTVDYNEPGDFAAELADRDRDTALDDNLKGELHEIDRALARIDDGTYGICMVTGKPIPVDRLRALPWATMTVEAAEQAVQ